MMRHITLAIMVITTALLFSACSNEGDGSFSRDDNNVSESNTTIGDSDTGSDTNETDVDIKDPIPDNNETEEIIDDPTQDDNKTEDPTPPVVVTPPTPTTQTIPLQNCETYITTQTNDLLVKDAVNTTIKVIHDLNGTKRVCTLTGSAHILR